MLDLNAFHHLPSLAALLDELAQPDAGMVVVAGSDAHAAPEGAPNLSSGRALIYGIVARRILSAHPRARTALVSEHKEPQLRLSPRMAYRARVVFPKPDETYPQAVVQAIASGYPLLIAEKLEGAALSPLLRAAEAGCRVVTQLDAPLAGAWVARYLQDLAGENVSLKGLGWVIAVQRLPMLCEFCKKKRGKAYHAAGCPNCEHTGRRGEVAVFDVWRAQSAADPLTVPSVLSFQQYARGLAAQGLLAPKDAHELDAAQLYRTFFELQASREHTQHATQSLRAQVAELELAKRALEQQYRASFALQEVGQKILVIESVQDLAAYISRRARELCGADRAVLYLLHRDATAEIVALNGWDPRWLHTSVSLEELFRATEAGDQPTPFVGYPPGIPKRVADLEGAYIRAGLRVPLIAQREVMGALIFHSTVRKAFDTRDAALLHALANASAAAIQRADLIDRLRDKIGELEAAQAEIVVKERLERELELARQVQQNMLPRIFPLMPGVSFYARNETARQVGGDFYDVFVLDAGRVGVVIADVSDKGMPAALFMALTRSLVRAEAPRAASPMTVLRRVHRLLTEVGEPTQFVTLFYGVLDLTARTLTYVRAGHDYPLLLRGAEAMLLHAPGTLLGMLDEDEVLLTEMVLPLEPGDRLVLYTDGLTDALNPREELFSRARLIETLQASQNLPVEEMGDALFNAVHAHEDGAETFDDMTLLIVEIKPDGTRQGLR